MGVGMNTGVRRRSRAFVTALTQNLQLSAIPSKNLAEISEAFYVQPHAK